MVAKSNSKVSCCRTNVLQATFLARSPSGNLLQYCCLRAQFGAPFVPCRGMVSGALIGNFVLTLALLFLTLAS